MVRSTLESCDQRGATPETGQRTKTGGEVVQGAEDETQTEEVPGTPEEILMSSAPPSPAMPIKTESPRILAASAGNIPVKWNVDSVLKLEEFSEEDDELLPVKRRSVSQGTTQVKREPVGNERPPAIKQEPGDYCMRRFDNAMAAAIKPEPILPPGPLEVKPEEMWEDFLKNVPPPLVKTESWEDDFKPAFDPVRWPEEPEPKHQLSSEQKEVLDLVLQGENVFFTGSAGTGKSLVLEHIKYHLRKKRMEYSVTAPTGSSSILVGGQTLHSWAGVGLGDKPVGAYIKHAKSGYGGVGKRRFAWRETDVLIIDEISMVCSALLSKDGVFADGYDLDQPRSV